jgi:hypothetical protein
MAATKAAVFPHGTTIVEAAATDGVRARRDHEASDTSDTQANFHFRLLG